MRSWGLMAAGFAAGCVTGLFGGGGGMVLVPLLGLLTDLEEKTVFPASISIILPVCIVSLVLNPGEIAAAVGIALPYLLGSAAGGYLAGKTGNRIPVLWLHRVLGIFVLWGGLRYLC